MIKKKRQIFRTEVIEAMSSRHGEVILIRPISFSLISIFIVIILLVITLFLFFGEYTQATPVKGVLKSRTGDTEIMAYQPGIVEEIYLNEGDFVSQGTSLYKIRTDKQGESGSINNKLISSLKESIALINEKIIYQKELNKFDVEDLISAVRTLKQKAKLAQEEINIKNDYKKLLASELSIISKLRDKKQVSQTEYNAKYAQLLEARLVLKSLSRAKLNFLEQAKKTEKSIRNITVQGKSMVVGYQQNLANIQRDLANKESDRFYIITAPNDGIVANVFVRNGTFIEMNKPLMILLPKNHQLVAEIYIPTSAIGQVKIGHKINLRYQAFPFQKFGIFSGTIENISQTLIQPFQAEVSELVEAPSYRAIVMLNKQNIDIKNQAIKLQTGMLLDADIVGETRSFFGWIFEPMMTAQNNS
ncbi:HlyD family efflux transporter periplasmic adaptor subunit [Shewanella sp. VB17]|uniref:HlyD family secretion protein n=1 Tax=Shewanella sp. VB17 TaxID=2739432 RepID=UPI0015649301|nr:HlyD family efflux transporter periplasmic adaptor subunit [Shewanella sp. VB17]NRD74909.1 HlyD family efflux transporter periplasmic adaptor subunit [Shewanella sp. VB17]